MTKVPQEPAAKRAALYVRVSTAKQAEEGLSLEDQLSECRGLIEARQDYVHSTLEYEERGVSGKTEARPEFTRLKGDAAAGGFDVLVVVRMSRFGRNARDVLNSMEELEELGVTVHFIRESIDTSTATGRLLRTVLAAVAQFENDVKAEMVSGAARSHAAGGRAWGGRFPPYGYVRRDKQLVIEPRQAEVVRRIYRQALEGLSQHAITRRLNDEGIPSPTGKRWEQASVGRLLRRALYYGATTHKGEVACEEGNHERVITREQWDAVQAAMAQRDNAPSSTRGRRPKAGHLFTGGLLRCRCGYAMRARTYQGGDGTPVYFCGSQRNEPKGYCIQTPIRKDALDPVALDYFLGVGVDLQATQEAWDLSIRHRGAQLDAATSEAERSLSQAVAAWDRVNADYTSGAINSKEWRELRDGLEEGRAAAAAEIETLKEQRHALDRDAVARDAEEEVLRTLAEFRDLAAGAINEAEDFESLRAALGRFFSAFRIEPDPIDPENPERFLLAPVFREEAVERWGYREFELTYDENGAVVLGEDGHPVPDPSTERFIPPVFSKVPLDLPTRLAEMRHTV